MRNIDLYIAGKRVDLDDKSLILFTYTMEDLYDPVVVRNSYSKQITLKGTANNNKIFGEIFRSDRKTVFGDKYTGMQFNVLRKTPFAIYDDKNALLEMGYMKLDSIDRSVNGVSYKISLFGELGAFFYNLTYGEDGDKRTLNDLVWRYYGGTEAKLTPLTLNKDVLVEQAWRYLEEGNSYLDSYPLEYWDIINFAPAYNGLPSDFDANKALDNGVLGITGESDEDGNQYYNKDGCTTHLVKMTGSHTEWEMKNIRPYLQRPVVRVSAIITAIVIEAERLGYKMELDSDFFNANNKIYHNAWITLPLIATKYRNSSEVISSILSSSLTPCDYLLMIAKMCGLLFSYDKARKVIKLQTRHNFFNGEIIDIEDRIAADSINITPLNVQSKWYQLGGDKVVGEDASRYKEQYERPYGVQRVNTGYEFNSEVTSLTKTIPSIGAADVIEKSHVYAIYGRGVADVLLYEIHPIKVYETLTMELYNGDDKMDFALTESRVNNILLNDKYPYEDWLPKVQFHDADNKSSQGEHCFVLFDSVIIAPSVYAKGAAGSINEFPYKFYVSDDHPDMAVLNSDKPCWNFADVIEINKLPSFRRTLGSYTMEWGKPMEVFTHDNWNSIMPLYERYWRDYLTDKYDVDSRRMKCKVNLMGMQVGQNLMRCFFYYDNALWVLNKIDNHSITTDDLTECEFVKVKDKWNYTDGQIL